MKFLLSTALVFSLTFSLGQGEVVSPLLTNPHIEPTQRNLYRSGSSIDSTFIYNIDTLDLIIEDNFATNRFVQYDADYGDANVNSVTYYQLMNATNTVPLAANSIFCDSAHAHREVTTIDADTLTLLQYFSANTVWVNNLNAYPVQGVTRTLFQECYVLFDTIIGVTPDPDVDTVWYTSAPTFVQDSATVFFVDYNDPTTIWVDNYAYHNYRYAVDPWSLGVVTFDGIDENGWPYDFENLAAHEEADILTSRPINLSGFGQVYLTFIYQSKGYGNEPEANDSLLLDWWLPDSNAWYPSQWYAVGGITPNQWDTVHWAVPNAACDNGFRFRFRNWASTSGALDHWHIDYVSLKDTNIILTNFADIAISEPITSLLDTYTSVPWDHYKELTNTERTQKMLDTLRIRGYNSDLSETNFAPGEIKFYYGGVLEQTEPLPNIGIAPEWNGNWAVGMSTYRYPLQANYTFDTSGVTGYQATFDIKLNIDAAVGGGGNSFVDNDTTYFQQKFANYYAYDDGSAEAAYGITGSHSLLAYRFVAYQADTLKGVLIHWVPSVDDHSDKEFLLTIWDDNAGQPGNIIYQDDYFNTNHPEYSSSMNGFKFYQFMYDSVPVPQTFYIGWEQLESVSLNVGMDFNTDNGNQIFRNVSGTWQTSAYDASLLIRPVFSTEMNPTLGVEEQPYAATKPEVTIYPNPANTTVTIQTSVVEFTVSLYDLTGRQVLFLANETQLDISELTSGIYIVDLRDANGVSLYSGKLIKE